MRNVKIEPTAKQKVCQDPDERGRRRGIQTAMTYAGILCQTRLQVIEAGYMDPEDKIKGSEQHYDFFESLLTGIFCCKRVMDIYSDG